MKTIRVGREQLEPGHCLPRHRHLLPYAIVVVDGQFEQDSYAGRVRVAAGDLLILPTLDAHANRMPARRGATILRLPWSDIDDLGGVFALPDPDAIIRTAERDLEGAAHLARAQASQAKARPAASDLPDQLAAELVRGGVASIGHWSEGAGVARETVARGFTAAFGVSARQFRSEIRARAAWLAIVRTRDNLAAIAAATGFADQAHMTRSVRALTGAPPSVWRRDLRAQALCRAARPRDPGDGLGDREHDEHHEHQDHGT